MTEQEIENALGGVCKLVTKNYVVYKRDWLAENIDLEVKLIKDRANRKDIKPFNKADLDKYLAEQYKKRSKENES